MKQYLALLQDILDNGETRADRTGTGTLSVFARQLRFNLQEGFPLLTTKKLHIRSILHELIWFLKGETNINYLKENGVRIWDEWADAEGNLGPVYGSQWRAWPKLSGETVDQISAVIESIKTNPTSRRHVVSAWNVGELHSMALPPCHMFFQFYVSRGGLLNLQFYMRSTDTFLGLPFNVASYAFLLHMVAEQCGLKANELIYLGGDVHLYLNHIEQAKQQLERTPTGLPQLKIKRKPPSIFDYRFEDFEIVDYIAQPHIKAEVSV